MREIVDHKTNPANDKLVVKALDGPGAGGASHIYGVFNMELGRNSAALDTPEPEEDCATIIFQCGPINEHGVNGVTQEVLLAIVADRLRSFQAGEFSCKENAAALTHVETALLWLQKRTLDRMRRGVEGTHQK